MASDQPTRAPLPILVSPRVIPDPPKKCLSCGKVFTRRLDGQTPERKSVFRDRKYCSHACALRAFHDSRSGERTCAFCGKPLVRKTYRGNPECLRGFLKRKHCDLTCRAGTMTRGDLGPDASRKHAQRVVSKVACRRCGATRKLHLHHKDGNPLNNDPGNLDVLCASCHPLQHKEERLCVVCGRQALALRLCRPHYRRFKRHGDPRLRCRGSGKPQLTDD